MWAETGIDFIWPIKMREELNISLSYFLLIFFFFYIQIIFGVLKKHFWINNFVNNGFDDFLRLRSTSIYYRGPILPKVLISPNLTYVYILWTLMIVFVFSGLNLTWKIIFGTLRHCQQLNIFPEYKIIQTKNAIL